MSVRVCVRVSESMSLSLFLCICMCGWVVLSQYVCLFEPA